VDREHVTGSVITGAAVSDAVVNVTAEPGEVAFAGGYFAVDVVGEDLPINDSAQLVNVRISSHAADPAQPILASAQVPTLLISGPQEFTYHDNGLLASDGRWLFQWNAAGRLAQVNTHPQLTAAGAVPIEVRYLYDGDGRLVCRESHSGVHETAVVTNRYYLYEDDLLVMEIEDGLPVREYTYGPDFSGGFGTAGGIGGLLAVRNPQTAAVFLPFTDIHGHVRGYVDASSGRMVARYDYSPFGKVTRATGELAGQFSHGMHTMFTDPLTGLVRYRHRWYDPSTARWLSPDPLGEDGSPNRYQFCGNDPINRFDADGRLTFFWHGNWGCPGRVNGLTGTWRERDRFPRRGDPDWQEPADEQDWCYYHHDTCLADIFCGYNGLYTNRQFTEKEKDCDDQLGDCLFALPGFHIKAAITGLAFRTLIGPMRVARYAPKRRSGSFRPSHLQSHFPDQACSCNHPHPVRQPGLADGQL
jgi:RHS repeat-associated protein